MSSVKLISILCRLGSSGILAPWVMAALLAERPKAASAQDFLRQKPCQKWTNPWVRTLLVNLTGCVCLGEGRVSACC